MRVEIIKESFEKYYRVILLLGIGIFFVFRQIGQEDDRHSISMTLDSPTLISDNQSLSQESLTDDVENEDLNIFVDIKGAVRYPGVYSLANGSRMFDLIEMAGGLTEEADKTYLNQASLIYDQAAYYIYSIEEVLEMKVETEAEFLTNPLASPIHSEEDSNLTNINTAGLDELVSLPGIGPTKAQAIISYREQNGSFKSIESLQEVSGIGPKTFEKLKDLVDIK